ncbi:unnamed protein product [Cylicostephanus goldi]|uniref:Uncharacterized protein n=1 Tax=Cylicostephanus goldi TaxID=71465 RepID=A0A3P7MEP1_CYLGO|nr:unnamed protein product [Cylicostephanus goldi]
MTFTADPSLLDDEVRLSLASSYHEILTQHSTRPELLQPFIDLLRGGSAEVVGKLTFNMDKILPILYKCASSSDGTIKVSTIQLDRILIGCNQILRGTGSWRSHAALLENMSVLKNCLTYTQLADTFIPVLQKEVLTAAACELSRTETRSKGDKEDTAREKEEERLWNEERLKAKVTTTKQAISPKNSVRSGLTLPRAPEYRAKSPWRTQRRAVAVVRPQPVVVMRSGSPAPKPDSSRPSRLPLSTALREKEKETLKKGSQLIF